MKLLSLIAALLISGSAMAGDWSHNTALNFINNTGNSRVMNLGATHDSSTSFGLWNTSIFGAYNYGEDDGFKTKSDWMAGFRLGRQLNPKTEVYLEEKFLGNKFENYDFRWTNEIGVRYDFFGGMSKTAAAGPAVDGSAEKGMKATTGLTYGNHFLYLKAAYQAAYEDAIIYATPPVDKLRHNSVVGLGYGTMLTETLAFAANADWIRTLGGDDRNIIEGRAGIQTKLSKLFGLKAEYVVSWNDQLDSVVGFVPNTNRAWENFSSAYIVALTAAY